MNRINFGQAISILANLGVIAGIGFLAAEIRQGNALLDSESRGSRAEIRREWFENLFENERLAAVMGKARRSEALTEDEQLVWNAFIQYTFTGWQVAYQDWQAGQLEVEDLPTEGWRLFLADPGVVEQWDRVKMNGYAPDFREWVDSFLLSR